ncbi:DUF4328 domain-containing protein [Kribbella sp. NBC_00889]|uniref:DUF4328 domain-containing protein n=1 Tax=Kribbella sp. NBC_00889 TaxID=2975974 RepID=UPI0038645B2D|nr:DUF4328 domain-containing protein [Kribbella sp. NBC_00889]
MSHPQPAVLVLSSPDQEDWQPHAAEEFQHVGTVGKLAIGLLGASTITHLLSTWSDWNTYGVVHRYLGGMPNVDDADLNRADAIAKVTAVPNVIISVAAAVVFVIWLWRARVNSEVFCQADHRRSHGWVLASWFCPGPNLWYPKQIVDDVWLASDPKTPVYADDLRRFRTPALTSVWWVAWIGALAFDVVVRRFLMWMEATVGSLRGIALAGTASLVLTAVSAVAATMVIRRINTMQTTREWVPWWDQREPKLMAVPTYANDDTDEQPAISEPIAASAVPPAARRRELQMAGGGPVANPFAPSPAPPAGFPGDGVAAADFPVGSSPFAAGPAAPAAFGGDAPVEEAPKWSPFAPVVESWQNEDVDSGPATEQFNAVETWRDEQQAQQTSYEPEPGPRTSWNDYLGAGSENPLSSSSQPSSWRDETPPMTVVEPDPYSYQPQQPAQPEPSWAASYSEPYTYDSTPDYLTQTTSPVEAEPAPEPEPAPVARAGRRAARVAVDSPSAIEQPTVASHSVHAPSSHTMPSSHVSASSGYYEPSAPALGQQQQDDFLTPSKPLPPVPSYGPEPSYTPEPTYTPEPSYSPEPTYTPEQTSYTSDYSSSYDDSSSSYQTSYEPTSDYSSYNSEYTSTSNYESTDYGYSSPTSDHSSNNYETPSYDSYSPTSYSGSEYSTEYSGSTESYETYSPNYATESYGAPYTPDYSQAEQQPSEYQQQAYYTPEQHQQPEQEPEQPTTPRTHPRRRWV